MLEEYSLLANQAVFREVFSQHGASLLVESWAWGHKSACDVQPEAEAEFNDKKNLSKTLKISVDFGSAILKQLAGLRHDGT